MHTVARPMMTVNNAFASFKSAVSNLREHGDAEDYAAFGSSSTSISGDHRLNTMPNSRFNVFTRV